MAEKHKWFFFTKNPNGGWGGGGGGGVEAGVSEFVLLWIQI